MGKGGRPRIEIDIALVEELCQIQCTGEEIASALKVSYDTLNRRVKEETGESFADFFKKHSESGKSSLRRMQWKAAQKGNTTMLIWLGKQYLGQRDTPKDDDDNKAKLDKLVQAIEGNIQPEAEDGTQGS
jgi:hypothetical protein